MAEVLTSNDQLTDDFVIVDNLWEILDDPQIYSISDISESKLLQEKDKKLEIANNEILAAKNDIEIIEALYQLSLAELKAAEEDFEEKSKELEDSFDNLRKEKKLVEYSMKKQIEELRTERDLALDANNQWSIYGEKNVSRKVKLKKSLCYMVEENDKLKEEIDRIRNKFWVDLIILLKRVLPTSC